jgi:hypothetical protein
MHGCRNRLLIRSTLRPAAITVLMFVSNPILGQEPPRGNQGDESPEAMSSARPAPGESRSGGWTRSRMRDAKPVPLPNVDPSEVQEPPRKRNTPPPLEGSSGAKDARGGVARYSGNPNSVPLKWAGTLFFNKPGDRPGEFHRCTAQFVSADVLLSAAHCARDEDTGAFFTNFRFALQFDKGNYSRLYGYKCVATKNGWLKRVGGPSHWAWDFATILMDGSSRTGWFGWQWNWRGKYEEATKIGYPGGLVSGRVIQVDAGPLSFTENGSIVRLLHGKQAEQAGTSGGAWVGDFGKGNYVISVSSFTRGQDESIIYGPYFDDSLKQLFDYTARGCR